MALTPTQLAKQQRIMGQATQVAGGAAALVGQGMGMIDQAKQIQTTAPSQVLDPWGKPVFNLGDFTSQVSAIKPQGATVGEVLTGTLQGASGGAAFGLPGAAIGAVVGASSSLLFGSRRKTLQKIQLLVLYKILQNSMLV